MCIRDRAYKDEAGWAKKALLNTACSGKFTSDRTIQQYVDEIWHLDKVDVYKRQGDISAELYGDCRQAEVRITLPAEGEELLVTLLLSGKQASPYVESGSFCIPLAGNRNNYRINKPGNVLNPKTDIADNANHVDVYKRQL